MDETVRGKLSEEGILVEGVYYSDAQKYFREIYETHIDGIIRIHDTEYQYMNLKDGLLTHFNLQVCHHEVGNIYTLPRILTSGSYSQGEEKLPDLSFINTMVCECIEVREHVQYEDLQDNDFRHSFTNIQCVEYLKKVILSRYGASLPDLSNKDILDMGVSITKLRIL